MKKIFILFIFSATAYSQSFPLKIPRTDDDAKGIHSGGNSFCESRVKVVDERPSSCDFNGGYYFYPVYIDNFDFKEDLSNNWRFSLPWTSDDNYEGEANGLVWMGNAYNNGNIYTNNGNVIMEFKKESTPINAQANSNVPAKDYDFTGSMLWSLFRLKQGVFEARIKLPENAYLFPAYWLRDKQEIDMFEFFDDDMSSQNICDTYHQMKMTIHEYRNLSGSNSDHCSRGKKFTVSSDFFDDYHTYKVLWTDYKIHIYLDGVLVGYATKYYNGPYFNDGNWCDFFANGNPLNTRDCNYMSSSVGCTTYLGWPINECTKWNKVDKDNYFPTTSDPMSIIFSMILNKSYSNTVLNAWSGYSQVDKQYLVDWIKIYQPFSCGASQTIYDENDFKNQSGNTNFLTGYNINIGNSSGNANYLNQVSSFANGYHEFPTHILATDEIVINGETIFESGTYLRAEIVNCAGGFNQFQRSLPNTEKLFLTDEEVNLLEKRQNDSLTFLYPFLNDSLSANKGQTNKLENFEGIKSIIDNGAITIYPNPTRNLLYFDLDEEDFNDLKALEIIDILGRKTSINVSSPVEVSSFPRGFYNIKFSFTNGIIIVKNFLKE
jgi:beta-glucanase (GH16 family)